MSSSQEVISDEVVIKLDEKPAPLQQVLTENGTAIKKQKFKESITAKALFVVLICLLLFVVCTLIYIAIQNRRTHPAFRNIVPPLKQTQSSVGVIDV